MNINPKPPLIPGSMSYDALQSSYVNFKNMILTNDINVKEIIATSITDGHATLIGSRLMNLDDPVNPTDAVNMHYIDNKMISITSLDNEILFNTNGVIGVSTELTFVNDTLLVSSVNCSNITTDNLVLDSSVIDSSVNISSNGIIPYTLTMPSSFGTIDNLLTTNSSGVLSWTSNKIPAGNTGEVQLSNGSIMISDSNLTFDGSVLNVPNITSVNLNTNTLNVNQNIIFQNSSGQMIDISTPSGAYDLIFNDYPTNNSVLAVTTSGLVKWVYNGIVPITSVINDVIGGSSSDSIVYNNNYNLSGSNLLYVENRFYINKLIQSNDKDPVISSIFDAGSTITNMFIQNNIGYLTTSSNIILVNLLTETIIDTIALSNLIDVIVINNIIYALSTTSLYKIINGIVSTLDIVLSPLICKSFYISGKYAYIITQGTSLPYNSLIIVDITSMLITGINKQIPNASKIVVSNSIAYVACTNQIFSLMVLDCNNPKNPILVNRMQLNYVTDLAIVGSMLYTVGTYFVILDISDIGHITIVSSLVSITNLTSIILNTNTVYVSNSSGNVYIINTEYSSSSIVPTIIGTLNSGYLTNVSKLSLSLDTYSIPLYAIANNYLIKIFTLGSNFEIANVGSINTNNMSVSGNTTIGKSLSISGNLSSNSIFCKKFNYPNIYNVITTTTSSFTKTITNTSINQNNIIIASIMNYTNSFGFPQVQINTVTSGSFVCSIINLDLYVIPIGTSFDISYMIF